MTDIFKDDTTESSASRLMRFCAGENVDLYHSTVYYARAYLINCTDFVSRYKRKPTLKECEDALRDLRWLRNSQSSTSARKDKL